MSRATAALPAVALVLAAGCGSGSTKATTLDYGAALRASVDKTTATSAKTDLTVDTEAAGTTVSMHGVGAFDGSDGSMVLTVAGMQVEERITGGTLYLKVPGQSKWYVLELADLVGTSFGSSASPNDSLKVLLAADNGVTKVGTETVRGASATHYKGTITLDEAHLGKLGGFARDALQKLVDSGVTEMPFDAWVDGQNRLVKLTEATDVTSKGVTAHVVLTLLRYDFGTKVAVVAPPASQQQDGAPLLASLKAATG